MIDVIYEINSSQMAAEYFVKRVYEPYHKNDGYRILVDRLWPRGLSKENAHVDCW